MKKLRFSELVLSFYEHDSAQDLNVFLTELREGFAEVAMEVTERMLVDSDISPGRVVQGGFVAGVLADFASVYAAMTLSRGHALLLELDFKFEDKSVLGETLYARAEASRKEGSRRVEVSCVVENERYEVKGRGNFTFLLAKNEVD